VLIILVACCSLLLPTVANARDFIFTNQVNQIQTITLATSTITSQSQLQTLINRAFVVNSTTGTNHQCEKFNFSFTGNQGQYVSGNFTSYISLDFYIISDQSYQNWLKSGSCGNSPDAIVSQLNTMSYGFSVALPSSGLWDIVLVNFSNTRNASGFMMASVSFGSYTVTKTLLGTLTLASTFTNTTATPSAGIPGFPVESIAVGIIMGVIALMVLRGRRRVRQQALTS